MRNLMVKTLRMMGDVTLPNVIGQLTSLPTVDWSSGTTALQYIYNIVNCELDHSCPSVHGAAPYMRRQNHVGYVGQSLS